MVIAVLNAPTPEEQASKQPITAEEKHENRVAAGFSNWDGSHTALTKWIKESMNDPSSYEHIKTTYIDNGKTLQITAQYRGKNAYGALIKAHTQAIADYDGKLIEIIK